ncbi:hypothetical protein L6E12_13445 [Actinokineospora sp. PR83]|uniref:hypothetical protein n=1 Tax=Actinokineospora sp. PR83 TaxID=2884908 RepID=UPI001F39BE4C|nr:hypothetical protein [Actinokineospora sp. PR83]MCG8916796.1 hypothetical protein [Actinokineospora sp. PR83]
MVSETYPASGGKLRSLDPEHWQQRLTELDVSIDLFAQALDMAAADIRSCTEFDAPAMPGFMFWSRTNRYLAEAKVHEGWRRTNRDSILRLVHPSSSHAITAISAAGGVGDLDKEVRSKNPKGEAMARLVEKNGQIPLMTADQAIFGKQLDDIPVWFLLYKWQTGTLLAELSLPVKMNGKYVNEWQERLPLALPDLQDPGTDISLLDDPLDSNEPDVDVELLEG